MFSIRKRRFVRGASTDSRERCPARFRPKVESLEDRTLLSFDFASNYSVGTAPHSIVLRDLNRAGLIGAVVANSGSNDLSVLLSNRDGTLRDFGQRFGVGGTGPTSLVMGDFNGDGNLDVAVANAGSHTVSVLLGNGDGSFRLQAPPIDVGTTPTSLAVGDLRGNGTLDLVVALTDNRVAVLLGNGDGSFQLNATLPMGSGPMSVALGDLGNGHVGMVVANQANGTVSVRLGNGDGTFGNATNYAAGTRPSAVTVADLTGTGKQDIAVANSGSNNVSILLGNGDGTFKAAVNYDAGAGPSAVAVRDFHNRNKKDLVVTNAGSGNVSVLFGNGDGTFQLPLNYGAGTSPSAVGVTDLDGNRTPDLIVVNQGSNNVTVLLNHPEATKFDVSADASSVAGNTVSFVVTAKENFDNTVTAYRGVVHFTSTDGQAGLPDDYPFRQSDQGQHTFTVTLKTAGVQTVTATDRSTASITGTSNGVSVAPAAASTLTVTGPATSTVGEAVNIGVTALDPFNNTATGYTGRIHFTSTDPRATLPPDFRFAPADHGARTFSVNLNSAGNFSVVATDTVTSTITGSVAANVSPAETTTSVTTSNGQAALGEALTFSISVSPVSPGGGSPPGSVTLQDGSTTLAVVPLSNGIGSFTTTGLGAGKHSIQGVYAGDGNYLASSSPKTLTQLVGNVNQRFIGQTYLDLLHRPVDSSGLATWTGLLQGGALAIQVVFAIEQSAEYRNVVVQSAYNRYLRRAADPGGLSSFVAFLGNGGTVEQLNAIITASPEYFQRFGGGTNDGFLTALYRDGLGRNIDPTGQAAFGQALAQGAARGQVTAALFGSTEYLQNLVQSFYQAFLHRNADPVGLGSFLSALQNGSRDEEVIAIIVGSPEYMASV